MNERIMDYAEQARLHAQKIYPEVKDIKDWGRLYHEKFAELIVRECLEKIYSVTIDNPTDDWDQGYDSGLNAAAETIKTHFGVEEWMLPVLLSVQ